MMSVLLDYPITWVLYVCALVFECMYVDAVKIFAQNSTKLSGKTRIHTQESLIYIFKYINRYICKTHICVCVRARTCGCIVVWKIYIILYICNT